jgi:hypothetical protein
VIHVDWWSWECASCGFRARDRYTVNPQQAVAKAIVRCHIAEHDAREREQVSEASSSLPRAPEEPQP